MTTAVYGGEAGDGLQPGAGLLEFAGERIALDGAWTGDMAHLARLGVPHRTVGVPEPAIDRGTVELATSRQACRGARRTGKQVLDTLMGRIERLQQAPSPSTPSHPDTTLTSSMTQRIKPCPARRTITGAASGGGPTPFPLN